MHVCIHYKEHSGLCVSNVVGAGDVDSQVDDIIDVDVVRSSWVDGDVNNQLQSLPKGD